MSDRPATPNKVIIPGDRSQKQPVRAFCLNVQCLEASDRKRFEFDVEHADVACPKCGATESPMIGMMTLIHLLVKNPKGPIVGKGGIRYSMGCEAERPYLATLTNDEAATDQPEAANCPGCLKVAQERKLTSAQGLAVTG
jgi:hypothetical protein